jgi:hypothetical protein
MLNPRTWQVVMLAIALIWAYFALFPEDLDAFLAPISKLLSVTGAVAGGFYALLAVGVIGWVIVRVWGRPAAR